MRSTSLLIAAVAAVAAFVVSVSVVPQGALTPPDEIFPVFALLLLLESAAFGAGVAYVVRARRTLFGGGTGASARAVSWCIAYLLLAPVIHDYLHRITHVNGVWNWPALAGIEYTFHLGIVPVAIIVGAYLMRSGRARA